MCKGAGSSTGAPQLGVGPPPPSILECWLAWFSAGNPSCEEFMCMTVKTGTEDSSNHLVLFGSQISSIAYLDHYVRFLSSVCCLFGPLCLFSVFFLLLFLNDLWIWRFLKFAFHGLLQPVFITFYFPQHGWESSLACLFLTAFFLFLATARMCALVHCYALHRKDFLCSGV